MTLTRYDSFDVVADTEAATARSKQEKDKDLAGLQPSRQQTARRRPYHRRRRAALVNNNRDNQPCVPAAAQRRT